MDGKARVSCSPLQTLLLVLRACPKHSTQRSPKHQKENPFVLQLLQCLSFP